MDAVLLILSVVLLFFRLVRYGGKKIHRSPLTTHLPAVFICKEVLDMIMHCVQSQGLFKSLMKDPGAS